MGPNREDIESIPPDARDHYLLQQRVRFEPVIETPYGKTHVEVRIMYIWTDKPEAVTTVVRMGRGKMMGVDQNRDLEWVGASAGSFPGPWYSKRSSNGPFRSAYYWNSAADCGCHDYFRRWPRHPFTGTCVH